MLNRYQKDAQTAETAAFGLLMLLQGDCSLHGSSVTVLTGICYRYDCAFTKRLVLVVFCTDCEEALQSECSD